MRNWIKNIVRDRENRKKNLIKANRIKTTLSYVSDMADIFIVIILVVFFLISMIYVFCKFKVGKMDTCMDFIIASMAGLFLVVSLINKQLSDRQKYIWSGAIWDMVCTVVFIVVMIISLAQKNGLIARIISLASLFISVVIELKDYTKFHIEYAKKRKHDKELETNNLEKKGRFDSKFDPKNN